MDYKEKFEDFLGKIQGLLDNAKKQGHVIVRVEDLENTLTEIKDGDENERVRKAIVKHFELYHEKENVVRFHGVDYENILAWLENQKTIDILDKEEREFADNVDSYRKDMDEFYKKGYNAGREAEKQYWLEKRKEPELSKDLGEYVTELSKQFPEVSFAKLSRIVVRVKNWLEKQGEQKPYGQRKECLVCQFNYIGECKGSCVMKRSEQKSAWSEEDERLLEFTTAFIEANNTFCSWKGKSKKDILPWLKSIKQRYTWKPSEEQMNILNLVISDYYHACTKESDKKGVVLKSILEQLKQL